MAKFTKSSDFSAEITEVIGVLKESGSHDWAKAVARIAWGENLPTLDIRNMNITQEKFGKGISLTDEEADRLVDLLVENDYGSLEALESATKRKKNRYTITEEMDGDEDGIYVNIKI